MGVPAAKQGDLIVAVDTHLEQPPSLVPPIPLVNPFSAPITTGLSADVMIEKRPAATLGSGGTSLPPHIPKIGTFVVPPTNQGTIIMGSTSVFINKKPAARIGDPALTCNDPVPLPVGSVIVPFSAVMIG
ncbi:MAG: PAAR domain-containing protein [Alphaproteobacteria bacterium GM202ARS2]|nr:PAAR domain-containing protein [Alphaproteobacteria bacterium GM202ARS2]